MSSTALWNKSHHVPDAKVDCFRANSRYPPCNLQFRQRNQSVGEVNLSNVCRLSRHPVVTSAICFISANVGSNGSGRERIQDGGLATKNRSCSKHLQIFWPIKNHTLPESGIINKIHEILMFIALCDFIFNVLLHMPVVWPVKSKIRNSPRVMCVLIQMASSYYEEIKGVSHTFIQKIWYAKWPKLKVFT